MSTGIPESNPHALLGRPALRRYLEGYVRRRVRPADADDTVQAVLCAALEARRIPEDDEELRRWLTGIARKKIASLWARASRSREESRDVSDAPGDAAPVEERALADWAEREAAAHGGGEAAQTLGWMAREGEGEKLESIAAEANEPATRVRQRVSRMRRWLRVRWTAELAAAVGAVIAIALVAAVVLGRRDTPKARMRPDPIAAPQPSAHAYEMENRPALDTPDAAIPAPSSSPIAPAPTTHVTPRPTPSSTSTPTAPSKRPGKTSTGSSI